MMNSSFLNSLSTTVQTAEASSGGAHPHGRFRGTVTKVHQKDVNGRPVWEVTVKTAHGEAVHNRWGFSNVDIQNAENSIYEREKIIKSISRHKRLFVDSAVWSEDEANSKSWDDICSNWGALQGRYVQLVVKPDHKNPKYYTTFLNAPTDDPDKIDAAPVAQRTQSLGGLDDTGVSNRRAPGTAEDDIPF